VSLARERHAEGRMMFIQPQTADGGKLR
jgi:hypothetical protein